MVTWAEKVAWVGMEVHELIPVAPSERFSVKLCNNPGRCSYGQGDTLDEAIKNAAWGMGIDWWSVERKITDVSRVEEE